MPISQQEKEFVAYVLELLQPLGRVSAKSMFGGHGIYHNDLMFGLVADSVLFLKVDKENKTQFEDKGLEPFSYSKKGKEFKMSYYQAPEEALEDADDMLIWAQSAYQAALRSSKPKKKK